MAPPADDAAATGMGNPTAVGKGSAGLEYVPASQDAQDRPAKLLKGLQQGTLASGSPALGSHDLGSPASGTAPFQISAYRPLASVISQQETSSRPGQCSTHDTDMQDAGTPHADTQQADTQHADTRYGDTQHAVMQDADMQNIDIQDTDLQDAEMMDAGMLDADLQPDVQNFPHAHLQPDAEANALHGEMRMLASAEPQVMLQAPPAAMDATAQQTDQSPLLPAVKGLLAAEEGFDEHIPAPECGPVSQACPGPLLVDTAHLTVNALQARLMHSMANCV